MNIISCSAETRIASFSQLVPGDLFRMPGGDSVYMKLCHNPCGGCGVFAVNLSTNKCYSVADNKEIVPMEGTLRVCDMHR